MKTVITFLLSLLFSFQILTAQNKEVINDGPYKKYYETGELCKEGQYKDKERIGKWKNYYKNGVISKDYSYNNGKQNKEYISYFKDGVVCNKTIKVENVFVNLNYYESGKIRVERQVRTGYFKSFYESGELEVETNYLENELLGLWTKYYKNGKIEWLVNYKDGYRDGSYKHFYNNGDIKLEGNNTKDKVDGEEKRYLPNTVLEWKGNYDKGFLYKTWIKYDVNGKKIQKIKFKNEIITKDDFRVILKPTEVAEGVIERVPIYPGCENLLTNKTLKKCMNISVSRLVSKNFNLNVAGSLNLSPGKKRIYIMFKINKLGQVVDIKARSPHPALEKEVKRVIELLPNLKPGFQRGKPVIVPYSLPIVFRIAK